MVNELSVFELSRFDCSLAATRENVDSPEMCAQQRLGPACVSAQSDQCLAIQNVPTEDYNRTARMRRLIWIFPRRTCPTLRFNLFDMRSSFVNDNTQQTHQRRRNVVTTSLQRRCSDVETTLLRRCMFDGTTLYCFGNMRRIYNNRSNSNDAEYVDENVPEHSRYLNAAQVSLPVRTWRHYLLRAIK